MRLKSTFRRTLQGVVLLGLSFQFPIAGESPAESVLVFHVRWGVMDQTELALANPTDRVANFELFLIQNKGTFRRLEEVAISWGEYPPCATFWKGCGVGDRWRGGETDGSRNTS